MKPIVFTCCFRILFATEKPNRASNETTGCACLTSPKGTFYLGVFTNMKYQTENLCVYFIVCILKRLILLSIILFHRWFWHFYAVSVCWNGLLLAFYLNLVVQRQSHPQWLAGILDLLTGAPSTGSQGKVTFPWSSDACCFLQAYTLTHNACCLSYVDIFCTLVLHVWDLNPGLAVYKFYCLPMCNHSVAFYCILLMLVCCVLYL